jgi:ribonuclease-3
LTRVVEWVRAALDGAPGAGALDDAGWDASAPSLERAVTHRSWAHHHPADPHNEVLELLGDAVFKLMMTEWLIERYPDAQEGTLTTLRQRVESDEHLARVARRVGLGPLLRVTPNALRDESSVLAGAMEALLGALWQAGGAATARAWVRVALAPDLPLALTEAAATKPAWNRLQEHLEGTLRVRAPVEVDKAESGPKNDAVWTVRIEAAGRMFEGVGPSVQRAKAAAAEIALAALLADPPSSTSPHGIDAERDAEDAVDLLHRHHQRTGVVRWQEPEEDPDARQPWTWAVHVDGVPFTGQGRSKREARREAAARAIAWIRRTERA